MVSNAADLLGGTDLPPNYILEDFARNQFIS